MLIKVYNDGAVEIRELTLISHRGGKGFGPENTLQSLQRALDSGVEMIETDVRISSDGVPIIHHGPFLGLGLLGRKTFAEIRERYPDIPTLREWLDVAGSRCALNLEIKRCDAGVLAEVIAASRLSFPLLVSSFDAEFLESFRGTGNPAELGLLAQYEIASDRIFAEAGRCGASTVLPASFILDEVLVETAHEQGYRVIAWTVNSASVLQDTIASGADGVITDAYLELKACLEEGLPDPYGEISAVAECGGSTP